MKYFSVYVVSLAVIVFFVSGCGIQKPQITKINSDQYTIYVKGIMTDREKIMAQWQEAATATCNGEYKVVNGPNSQTIEGGVAVQIEGTVKCGR